MKKISKKIWFRSIVQPERDGIFNIQEGLPSGVENTNAIYRSDNVLVALEPGNMFGRAYYIVYILDYTITSALSKAISFVEEHYSLFVDVSEFRNPNKVTYYAYK